MLLQNNPFVPYWFQGILGNICQGYFHLQQVVLLQLHFLLSSLMLQPDECHVLTQLLLTQPEVKFLVFRWLKHGETSESISDSAECNV